MAEGESLHRGDKEVDHGGGAERPRWMLTWRSSDRYGELKPNSVSVQLKNRNKTRFGNVQERTCSHQESPL